MRVVSSEELRAALPMTAAIDALEHAFQREDPSLTTPLRTTLATPAGTLLSMPSAGEAGVGVKLVTLSEFNPSKGLPFLHAIYVLFDGETQRPEAVFDGGALTAIRTAAVSGLATRHLANADAERLVLFGAGVQAASVFESRVWNAYSMSDACIAPNRFMPFAAGSARSAGSSHHRRGSIPPTPRPPARVPLRPT